ncbi:putative inactive purple acid phosphatase 16 [Escovopsis weberi]|uniref:Putative inactive purple acid phosphatase 16 n=1 Tax=Escovopsis weberi TaxID=150374 RepID=A0A0M8MUX2_ESCWE|nr:putative inactive purple acid phosphatase 16 [Escovopsis weberi]
MFSADGTFQISIFEDLHFGENAWEPWGPQQDLNTVRVIESVLDRESPGLVVLNGDLITGENAFRENSTVYVDQMVGPMLARGLPWASTYGNHDRDFNLAAAEILAREQQWPNCLTRSMVRPAGRDDAGVSNYYVPVYAPGCSEWPCPPELLLWFFDSRGGHRFQERRGDGDGGPDDGGGRVALPGWVDAAVARWFRDTSAALHARFGRAIPSLAFVHIPTNASAALQAEHGRAASVDPHRQPGINDDYPISQQAAGWCPDGRRDASCAYGGHDEPFMRAVASTPGLIALFSAHDHGNTWCYRWDRLVPGMTVAGTGVNLCFGQHSGYGGYGNWIRGSRQVRVSLGALARGGADTWIRLESGDVVGAVSLNATFGRDVYPATPNTMTYCPTCGSKAKRGRGWATSRRKRRWLGLVP